MKKRRIFSIKNVLFAMCLSLLFVMGWSQTAHAEELTGTVQITGSFTPGGVLTAELVNSNNTGTLSYHWVTGLLSTGFERYYQKSLTLLSTDFGTNKFVYCEITSSTQTGTLVSETYWLTAATYTPGAVSGVKATAGNESVTLSWNALSGADRYAVYRVYGDSYELYKDNITTTSYTVTELTNGSNPRFCVIAHNSYGYGKFSEATIVTVTVGGGSTATPTPTPTPTATPTPTPVSISVYQQPESQTTKANSWVGFNCSSSATSSQWQVSTDGRTWTNISGATSNYYGFTATAADDGKQYRCVMTSGSTVAYSNVVKLTIESEFGITSQPTDITASVGDSVTFEVEAKGTGLTYQWQYRNAGTNNWLNSGIAAAKTAKMTFTVNDYSIMNGREYQCIVTDSNGKSVTSNTAVLKVNVPELKITTQPVSVTAAPGANISFSVKAQGVGLTYQWQFKNEGATNWVSSSVAAAKTANMKFTVGTDSYLNNRQYRCIVTDSSNKSVTTQAATLKLKTTIVTQPKNITSNVGDTVCFQVKAVGDKLTYQWQFQNAGATTWTSSGIAAAKTPNMKFTIAKDATANNRKYRCVITDATGKEYITNAVTLKVNTAIIAQPVSTTVAVGGKATFKVKAVGDGLTYQWQFKNAGSDRWISSSISAAKTANMTFSVGSNTSLSGRVYRCIVKDQNGKTLTSSEATLTVR